MDIQLTHDTVQAVHVLAAAGGGSEGILDLVSTKGTELQGVFRVLASCASIGFVLYQAIVSRGAMARILISGLAAGVFVWIVFNVTELQNRVDSEVNAAGVTSSVTVGQAPPLAALTRHSSITT